MSRVETQGKPRSTAAKSRAKSRSQAAPAAHWVVLDAVLLLLLGLAAFITLAVFYPSFTKPAGGIVNGWLNIGLGLGAYTIPVVAFLLPSVVVRHRLHLACLRGMAWAVVTTVLLSLIGGLYPLSGWGGILGDACANLGYQTLGQFYIVLVILLAVLAFARLAGRSVILPAARWLISVAGDAAERAEEARQSAPAAKPARAARGNGKEKARQARRAEVLEAELAAAEAPEGDSPVIRDETAAGAVMPSSEPEDEVETGDVARVELLAAPVASVPDSTAAPQIKLLADQPLPPSVELGIVEQPAVPDEFAAVVAQAGSPQLDAQVQEAAAEPGAWDTTGEGQLTLFPSTQADYELPPLTLLRDAALVTGEEQYLEQRSKVIERTLRSFNVDASCTGAVVGPRVTRYELKIGPGINVSRIHGLADNLALELAVKAVRIEAPIPGMSAVGIEVPNAAPQLITLKSILETPLYQRANHPLTVALGRDIAGSPIIANLAKMPHVLVAGATGSGKSVCLNALIISLLYRNAPDTLRLILIDPKRVEMTSYNDLPHLACPVVHDVGQAQSALKWAVAEMERRYRLLEARRARNIATFNEIVRADEQLPFIIIVVDELADLMMLAGQVIEKLICRIAQLSRAVGIHLVVATQRPDVKVITGTIKANIPSRVAFAVVSQIDSRTILDGGGAEKLLGSGDMLFSPIGENVPLRVQGCFLADDEIDRVVEWCRNQAQTHYDDAITRFALEEGEDEGGADGGGGHDELFREACDIVQQSGRASTSYLQRRLKIGYNRAARVMEELEDSGIVSAPDHAGNRKVL